MSEQVTAPSPTGSRSEMAYERTIMASVRTYMALLRTGLAIAGGGAIITSVLADGWPEWVVAVLSFVFVTIGFGLMLWGLRQYHQMLSLLEPESSLEMPSFRLLTGLTVGLQLTLVVVLILFLLS